MKLYSLRKTDGYDSNELLQVSEDRNLLLSWIDQDPPNRVDYYVVEEWEDGLPERSWFFADGDKVSYE